MAKEMERLTTNKSACEMSMLELAYNSCYVGEDKWVRYRDYEEDIDIRELARRLLKIYADGDDAFTDDYDFGDYITSCLECGLEDIEGLIAVFYRNLWVIAGLRERLKHYESLEEQGKLLKPSCAVGDTVYEVQELRKRIQPYTIIAVHVSNCGNLYEWELKDDKGVYSDVNGFSEDAIGETVFLTREDAEAALKELEEGRKA